MTKTIPHYLRIHRGSGRLRRAQRKRRQLWRAFAEVTNRQSNASSSSDSLDRLNAGTVSAPIISDAPWDMRCDGPAEGFPEIRSGASAQPSHVADLAAKQLADGIRRLERQLNRSASTIRRQEAALARLPVPLLTLHDDAQLANDLQQLLRRGALAAGCDAAGLYLLDEETTSLKLRTAFGLPAARLAAPARPLRGAVADLEALLGNPVVLDDGPPTPHWDCPERCRRAIAVRVSQADHPVGTLWLFSERAKKFQRGQIAAAEMLASQLAHALERDALFGEAVFGRRLRREVRNAAIYQQSQFPLPAPLASGWDIAGWTDAPGELAGQWYQWDVGSDGRINVTMAADASDQGRVWGAINAAQVRAAWQASASRLTHVGKILQAVNDTAWQLSTAPQPACLLDIRVAPETGIFELAAAGAMTVLVVGRYGYRPLIANSRPLGTQPDLRVETIHGNLQRGETLILASHSLVAHQSHPSADKLTQTELVAPIQAHLQGSAEEMMVALRRTIPKSVDADRTVVVLRRADDFIE